MNKNGVSPVVAIALLLVVAVVAVVSFQGWYQSYSSEIFYNAEVESNSNSFISIDNLIGKVLYFKNDGSYNVTIKNIKINGVSCNISQNYSQGISAIDLTNCTKKLTEFSSSNEIVVITNEEILTKMFYNENLRSITCTLDGIVLSGGESNVFYNSTVVSYGDTCHGISRTCMDESLGGDSNYNHSNCTVLPDPSSIMFSDNKSGGELYYEQTNVDGIDVVYDTLLGLYWEQTPSFSGTKNWTDAQSYCPTLGTGWRLPTQVEMGASLYDKSQSSSPYVIGGNNLFDGLQSYYWTNTRAYLTMEQAYRMFTNVNYLSLALVDITSNYSILCVKEDGSTYDTVWGSIQNHSYLGGMGQIRSSNEFVVDDVSCGSFTMYDTMTGLCWEQSPSTTKMNWTDAISHCEGKGASWRLPNQLELITLLYNNGLIFITSGRLSSIGFTGIQDNGYWSDGERSSTYADIVYLNIDTTSSLPKSDTNTYAICVKKP